MVDIIGHLTKLRFGDLEQSKSKDVKEVNIQLRKGSHLSVKWYAPTLIYIWKFSYVKNNIASAGLYLITSVLAVVIHCKSIFLDLIFHWVLFQYAGGIYSRLEAQFRSASQGSGRHSSSEKAHRYCEHCTVLKWCGSYTVPFQHSATYTVPLKIALFLSPRLVSKEQSYASGNQDQHKSSSSWTGEENKTLSKVQSRRALQNPHPTSLLLLPFSSRTAPRPTVALSGSGTLLDPGPQPAWSAVA